MARVFMLLCVTGVMLVIYRSGLSAKSYLIDDYSLIGIPQLQNQNLWDFVLSSIRFPQNHIDFYPIRDMSYWIDFHWFGADLKSEDLTVFRLHNFFLYFAIGLSLLFLLEELGYKARECWLLFLVWYLHPYHAEMLMWITARKDLLGILCAILFFYCYSRYRKTFDLERKSYVYAVLTLILFLISVFAKSILSLNALILGGWGLGYACWRHRHLLKNKFYLFFHGMLVVLSVLSTLWTKHFYSTINDMRFEHNFGYRISSALAALGRALVGWLDPRVNSIDVFNWGDWWIRNQRFIPVGVAFVLLGVLLLGWAWQKRSYTYFIYGVLFLGAYLPVSGLLFPHRNFYSVRYFEFPFLFLLLALVHWVHQQSPARFLSSKTISYVLVGLVGWQGFSQVHEAPAWSSPLAVVEKAYRLDPSNPSLQTERWIAEHPPGASREQLLIPECEEKLKDPQSPQPDGDLCWFYFTAKYKMFDSSLNSNRQWMLRHAKLHSDNYYEITKANNDLVDFVAGRGSFSADTILPPGIFNNEMGRLFYLYSLCLSEGDDHNDKKEKYWSYLIRYHLIREYSWTYFLKDLRPSQVARIQQCFKQDLRHHFTQAGWISRLTESSQWWVKEVGKGAPGERYGCGYSNPNGYDCGSTMDQASMVNLYAELYLKTKEKAFLNEAFSFAKNGNQMCSISNEELKPCGDGKAHGTWMMALFKLFIATKDYKVLFHLHNKLRIPPEELIMNDLWDFFELYRSYFLGNIFRGEALSEDFFPSLEALAVEKKIITPELIKEIKIILTCAYTQECQDHRLRLEAYSSPPVRASLLELTRNQSSFQRIEGGLNDSQASQNSQASQGSRDFEDSQKPPLWEKTYLWGGRRFLSRCGEQKDYSSIDQMVNDWRLKKYNESPKPFYYAEEGDNFAPVFLNAYNRLFAGESRGDECAHWEIQPQRLERYPLLYTYTEADDFVIKRRPLFVLSQLINKTKLRLWIVNNTMTNIRLNVNSECGVLRPLAIKIHAQSQVEIFPKPQTEKFELEALKHCHLVDSLGKVHPLYP